MPLRKALFGIAISAALVAALFTYQHFNEKKIAEKMGKVQIPILVDSYIKYRIEVGERVALHWKDYLERHHPEAVFRRIEQELADTTIYKDESAVLRRGINYHRRLVERGTLLELMFVTARNFPEYKMRARSVLEQSFRNLLNTRVHAKHTELADTELVDTLLFIGFTGSLESIRKDLDQHPQLDQKFQLAQREGLRLLGISEEKIDRLTGQNKTKSTNPSLAR